MLKSLKSLENTLSQIIDIFDQSIQFKDCYWINEVRLILKNYSWEKIGFRILNSLSLFSPAHSSFLPPFIRNLLDAIISSLHLSQERKQCLMKRISIRQTKNPSMADLFFNHKSWAKSWKENTRICECHLLKDLLDVKLWNGHISSWHYEPKNHEYISLLKTNINDILHPVLEKWLASFVMHNIVATCVYCCPFQTEWLGCFIMLRNVPETFFGGFRPNIGQTTPKVVVYNPFRPSAETQKTV